MRDEWADPAAGELALAARRAREEVKRRLQLRSSSAADGARERPPAGCRLSDRVLRRLSPTASSSGSESSTSVNALRCEAAWPHSCLMKRIA